MIEKFIVTPKEVFTILRKVINFIKKWFKEIKKQIEWLWKKCMWLHINSIRLHTRHTGRSTTEGMKFFIGFAIFLIIGIPTLCILFIYSFLKSL
jgi:hypothetical protein